MFFFKKYLPTFYVFHFLRLNILLELSYYSVSPHFFADVPRSLLSLPLPQTKVTREEMRKNSLATIIAVTHIIVLSTFFVASWA